MEHHGIGITNTGYVRQNNEDSFFVCNESIGKLRNLYIVADGMGGHQAGEIASAAAVSFFCDYIRQNPYSPRYTEELLGEAARISNDKVFALSMEDAARNGMGTTLSVCCVDDDNLYYAQIGDSRIYLFRDGNIQQLTEDHTFVEEMVRSGRMTAEEAQNSPSRHMLTRALGTDCGVLADVGYVPVADGDVLLLCSDGLTNMCDDGELAALLSGEGTLAEKAESLVAKALAGGGYDNVTVVLVSIYAGCER